MIHTCSLSGEPEIASCKLCRYWNSMEGIYSSDMGIPGECRRHAPRANQMGGSEWPLAREDFWCGDFEHII